MAQIVISIDTADKANSSITVDGKKLKNVYSTHVYGMDEPDWMSIEINQSETVGDDEGSLRKWTRLTASATEDFKVDTTGGQDPKVDRIALAELLLRRKVEP